MVMIGDFNNRGRFQSSFTIKFLNIFIIGLLTLMSFSTSVYSAQTVDLNEGNTTDDTMSPPSLPTVDDTEKYGKPTDNTLISIADDLTPGDKNEGDRNSENTTTVDENTINSTITSDNITTTDQTTINTNTLENSVNLISTNVNDADQDVTIQTEEASLDILEDINSSTNSTIIFELVNIGYQIEEEIGDILIGQEVEVIVDSLDTQETYIEKLKFTPSIDLENVKISINYLTEKPEEVEHPTIKDNKPIYGYVDIKLTANDEYIEEMLTVINFYVKKEWIVKNNLDENSIVLIRHRHGQWQQLETKIISSDNIRVYYESITPGFSTFAVVGNSLVKIDDPYTSNIMPEIPFEVMILLIIIILTSLIYILFKSKYIYFKDEKTIDNLKEYQN